MAKVNENISNLIDAQVPSFVGEEHPKFVQFLKAYYEWLEDSSLGATVYHNKNLICNDSKNIKEITLEVMYAAKETVGA